MRSNDWGSWGQWPGPGQSRGGAPWGSGPPPWIAGLFGLAQQGGTRAPKVRRGDVRAAILDVLAWRRQRLPNHPADRRAQRRA
jgi:hypothetical protein